MTVNLSPVAGAGPNQSAGPEEAVSLDGGASCDPDEQNPLTFRWSQSGGPAVTLGDGDSSKASFTTPATPAVLTFTLTVTDALGAPSAPDEAVVTVAAPTSRVYLPMIVRVAE